MSNAPRCTCMMHTSGVICVLYSGLWTLSRVDLGVDVDDCVWPFCRVGCILPHSGQVMWLVVVFFRARDFAKWSVVFRAAHTQLG